MLSKVRAGQPVLPMSAARMNAIIEATNKTLSPPVNSANQPQDIIASLGIIRCAGWNNTGADIAPLAVMGIKNDINFEDTDIGARRILELEASDPALHVGKWCVVFNGIDNEEIGTVIIGGISPVIIDVTDENHEFAEVTLEESYLTSQPAGSARIISKGEGTGLVRAVVEFPLDGPPPVWEATADESGGEITAKRVKADGTLSTIELTLATYDDGYKIRTGDHLQITTDAAGQPVALPVKGNFETIYILPAGTGATAETTTWDIDNQPSGYQGVEVEKWFRLYWSGTSGDPVYQFVRKPKYDSKGALVYISEEIRTTAFSTADCP